MKKILFGITSLTLGGAERVLVDIANALCNQYDITIFTIYANGELEKQLNEKIKLKSLYKVSYLELPKLNRLLIVPLKVLSLKNSIYKKKIKGDYNVEISFLEGPITRLFSVKNTKVKKIVWIHNDISKVFGTGLKSKIKKVIDKNIYSKYDTLIFVSKDNLEKFNEAYKEKEIKRKEKRVIYNYIDANRVIENANEKLEKEFNKDVINFVTVARLVPQKALDRLIRIHSELIKNLGHKHNFYIIGDGPEKEKLEKIIKDYKVEDSFFLLGKKENPYPYVKEADYFCLLSQFEGYGMVLEEAKILNRSIIITDTAAREAVLNYPNSVILGNAEQEIYEGLERIIKEHKEKKQGDIEKAVYDNSKKIKEIIEVVGE